MLKKFLAVLAMFYAAMAFAAVDVNTASPADLDSVKGIGPSLSGKIVDERKKSKFKDWGDLISRVNGVGDKTAAKLSAEGLTVNGATYSGAAASAPAKADTKTDSKAKPAAKNSNSTKSPAKTAPSKSATASK
ncbi:ComEA family DNA-binding protein [Ottowia sp.]|uniref:ComEA family DNA-binding protein n=1 Tax=Ottowia sp. TaxID=1898956 RepID=UPI003A8C78F5